AEIGGIHGSAQLLAAGAEIEFSLFAGGDVDDGADGADAMAAVTLAFKESLRAHGEPADAIGAEDAVLALQEPVAGGIEASVERHHERFTVLGQNERHNLIQRIRDAGLQSVD